jgi:DNA-directed RNA polymerase specialized sigma24 family protein
MDDVQFIEWVDQHQQTDEAPYILLIGQHQQTIGKICRLYKDTGADKGNLYQEIVFQLWKSASTDIERTRSRSWVYRIALTTAIAHNVINTSRLPDTLQTLMILPDHNVEFTNALKQLTDDDKAIMTLYLEDLNHAEIAAITGLAETVIGVKLNRIKKKVQQGLISSSEQSSIKSMWHDIDTIPKSSAELTEIVADRTSPIFNIQNGFMSFMLAKSMAKGSDIKSTLEDVFKNINSAAILAVGSRTLIITCLLLFARITITNNTAWAWVLTAALMLFITQITLLSKTWAKRISQMKNTIDHFRSQREFYKKGPSD